jgi:hypothetical protein
MALYLFIKDFDSVVALYLYKTPFPKGSTP